MMVDIEAFVRESNKIERILRGPTLEELVMTELFVSSKTVDIRELEKLVDIYEPGARLRDKHGLDVIVGNHTPPKGGPLVRTALNDLLHGYIREDAEKFNREALCAFEMHQCYEYLHPFTDGNGRSGRALWLWYMKGNAPLGFLHTWYYQSLQFRRAHG